MKLKIALYCFLAIFLGTYALSASAEIYKWKDSTGKMIYSDTPPPEQKAKTLHVYEAPTNSTINHNAEASNPLDATKRMNDEIKQSKTAAKTYNAKIKANNCKIAKENLIKLKKGGRIANNKKQDERSLLSDNDISNMRKQTQKDVHTWCN